MLRIDVEMVRTVMVRTVMVRTVMVRTVMVRTVMVRTVMVRTSPGQDSSLTVVPVPAQCCPSVSRPERPLLTDAPSVCRPQSSVRTRA